MGKEFQRGGSRGGSFNRGGAGRGGGFRGGSRGGRGGFGGGRQNWDTPPSHVIEVGNVMHPCEEYLVVKHNLPDKVPIFGRPVYLENKTKIGMIDDVFGPINEFMFSLKCDEGVQPSSFKSSQKVYMDPMHFLSFDRFLPKPKTEKGKGQAGGFGGSRGGSFNRGGFRGGNRGGSFGGNRGGGNFNRGGGNFNRGGFRGGNNFRRGG